MLASLLLWCAALVLVASAREPIVTYVDYVPRPDNFVFKTKFLDGDQGDEMLLERFSISNINRGALGGKPKLKAARIRDCQIQTIDQGAFSDNPVLEELEISNSSLHYRNFFPDAFEENCCPRLKKMILSWNDMNEVHIDLLRWLRLEDLILSNCSLRSVPAFATRNYSRSLLSLDLSSNQLRNLDYPREFYYFESLKELLLAYNAIEQIQEDIFKPLRSITTIKLDNNRMSRFPEVLFQGLSTLEEIVLASNRIEHVPVAAFRGTRLKKLDLSRNRLTYLPDDFCGNVRSAGALLLSFYFGGNPWQCACLNELLIEAKRLLVKYEKEGVAKYDGGRPVCVTSRRFLCLRPNEYFQVYDNFMSNR